MDSLSIENLTTLLMLILLQAVLGFDNLLYISIESKRVEEASQAKVRRLGIGVAIGLRIVLLFVVIQVIESFQDPFLEFHNQLFAGAFNLHALITLLGGAFILYTAMKEIMHLMAVEHLEDEGQRSARSAPPSSGSLR